MAARRALSYASGVAMVAGLASAACGARAGLLFYLGPETTGSGDASGGRPGDAGDDSGPAHRKHDASDDARATEGGPPEQPCRIYAVDDDQFLWSFDPGTSSFAKVGLVSCSNDGSLLYGIAAAPDGEHAYAVYYDGQIYRLSLRTAACEKTAYVPVLEKFQQCGMAFVKAPADAGADAGVDLGQPGATLYLASLRPPTELATLDTGSFTVIPTNFLGPQQLLGVALTGTSDGRLYGFYNTMPFTRRTFTGGIAQLDPASGHILSIWPVKLQQGGWWGFAFWAGGFYLFTAMDNFHTEVHYFDPRSGALRLVAYAPPGARVQAVTVGTCAPLD